jgi:hypothetical protein
MSRPIKYSVEKLVEAASKSFSVMDVLRYLNAPLTSASLQTHLKKRMDVLGIDTSHFKKGEVVSSENRFLSCDDILVYNRCNGRRENIFRLRRAMISYGFKETCSLCGIDNSWNNKKLQLEVDHIDQNPINNLPINLRFLCPNCHSQEEVNYRRE